MHVTLVIHPRKEQDGEPLGITSVFGGAKATQEADNVLVIQHLVKDDVNIKYVEVKKNRYDGELGRVYLKYVKNFSMFTEEMNAPNLKELRNR